MRAIGAFFWSTVLLLTGPFAGSAQTPVPPESDPRIGEIGRAASSERLESDIRRLVGFGTRHTLSDTVSTTRGIGAARRWIKAEFDRISAACGGCLEVSYQRSVVNGGPGSRIPRDVEIVNVVAIQRGKTWPNRYVIMSGDIDSRVSSALDGESDSPGANDNATGMAGAIEAARVLTKYSFDKSIVYVGLSGEEQGLFGGRELAQVAKAQGWEIEGVLNNDMIGNIEGIDGTIDNRTFRIFSEPVSPTETEQERGARRTAGGEVDGPSRQLARYVHRITTQYLPDLRPKMIYRLDRFGRGGHHRPFNDVGFPGVRIMEAHENYTRQHQNLRTEDGIAYGDVLDGVNFDYVARMTGVNAAVLAALAWAPPPPDRVRIRGAVSANTTLSWLAPAGPAPLGYRIWYRDTTAPQWETSVWVGNVTEYTLRNVIIDDFTFGVASVAASGNESAVVFPGTGR